MINYCILRPFALCAVKEEFSAKEEMIGLEIFSFANVYRNMRENGNHVSVAQENMGLMR